MAEIQPTMRVPMSEGIRQLNLKVVVTGRRRAVLRIRLGLWLIALAAKAMGVGSIDVDVVEEK